MPRVLFTDAAQRDVADALTWYETHAPEVATRFREALRAVVVRIEHNPKQFMRSPHDTRRALLRRFPYHVVFREQDKAIYIVAVFHTSRDPRTWERATI